MVETLGQSPRICISDNLVYLIVFIIHLNIFLVQIEESQRIFYYFVHIAQFYHVSIDKNRCSLQKITFLFLNTLLFRCFPEPDGYPSMPSALSNTDAEADHGRIYSRLYLTARLSAVCGCGLPDEERLWGISHMSLNGAKL